MVYDLTRLSIWLDALTPKQALLLGTIAVRLNEHGFKTLVTTRRYDYTEAVLKNIKIPYISVGEYGENKFEKLVKEIERIQKLIDVVGKEFDLAIAYPNPVAARIAFGLSKSYIALTDSPHSEIVSRLSLPLADYVVFSNCIPIEAIESYIYKRKTKLIQFNGIDEVEWLKDTSPDFSYVKSLGLEPYSYAVVRPPEIKASYYNYSGMIEVFEKLIKKLIDSRLKIIYLPRYKDDVIARCADNNKIIVPSIDKGVVGYKLIYYASVVITGGGTLAREAALLGTPGISLFPTDLYVDKCIQNKMFPLSKCRNLEECLLLIDAYLKDPEKYKNHALSLLKEFEKPSDVVLEIVKEKE